jgi:ribosomal protein S6--L-glutamate ligase
MQDAFKLGWVEWLSLPELGLPSIKAKVDTGAKTSALHAAAIEPFEQDGKQFVRFFIQPDPNEPKLRITCTAPIVDRRNVVSSNGENELRYVIETDIKMADRVWKAELTLTNRENMVYRMLLGRRAIVDDMVVDPNTSFAQPILDFNVYHPLHKIEEHSRPLKIALLTSEPQRYSSKRIVEAAEERGHDIMVINTTRCYLKMGDLMPEVHYDGVPLPRFDAVIPRIDAAKSAYGMAVLRQFANMGVFCLNKAEAVGASFDKLHTHQILTGAKIATPITAFADSPKDTEHLIDLVGGAPAVLKLLTPKRGRGVVLTETRDAAESLVDAFRGLDANFFIQEFVEEAAGADLRCFVIGGKVVGAVRRSIGKSERRGNLVRAGKEKKTRPSKEVSKIARSAAKHLGLHVASVDILESAGGPKVIGVSSVPSLERYERATGKDLADILVEYLEQKVAPLTY